MFIVVADRTAETMYNVTEVSNILLNAPWVLSGQLMLHPLAEPKLLSKYGCYIKKYLDPRTRVILQTRETID
jgi:hypothetical protein